MDGECYYCTRCEYEHSEGSSKFERHRQYAEKPQSKEPEIEYDHRFDLTAQSLGYQNLFEFLRSVSLLDAMDIQKRVEEKYQKARKASV